MNLYLPLLLGGGTTQTQHVSLKTSKTNNSEAIVGPRGGNDLRKVLAKMYKLD